MAHGLLTRLRPWGRLLSLLVVLAVASRCGAGAAPATDTNTNNAGASSALPSGDVSVAERASSAELDEVTFDTNNAVSASGGVAGAEGEVRLHSLSSQDTGAVFTDADRHRAAVAAGEAVREAVIERIPGLRATTPTSDGASEDSDGEDNSNEWDAMSAAHDKADAAQPAAGKGSSQGERDNSDKRRPKLPPIPTQFRAKARVWVMDQAEPMLVLYHHDEDNGRSREDYYGLVESRHQRFFTQIKFFDKRVNYMIYHKQERSPRACFIVPLETLTVDLRPLRSAVYMGRAELLQNNKTISCDHFTMKYLGARTEFCLDDGGKPIVVEANWFRAEILDFEVLPQPPAVFDPQRASKAKCGVIGSPADAPSPMNSKANSSPRPESSSNRRF